MAEEIIEVGIMELQKSSQGKSTPTAYFRVKSLQDYIIKHIESQLELKNTWEHTNFNGEFLIKIGVSWCLLLIFTGIGEQ